MDKIKIKIANKEYIVKVAETEEDKIQGLQNINFEISPIYNTLETKFNIWLSHIKKVVDAQIIPDELTDTLKTESGHAIHFVESLAYDDRDRVVETAHSYYIGDRNEFDLMVYKQN